VADVNTISPTNILVTAKKVGNTQLLVWDDQDHAQVIDISVDYDLGSLRRQLKTAFPTLDIQASSLNDSIALRGNVPSAQAAEQAVEMASSYGKTVHNFLEVAGGQQVMLQVRFAEVSKTVERDLGVNFGGTDGVAIFGNNAGVVNPFSITGSSPIMLGVPSGGSGPGTLFGRGMIGTTAFDYFLKALRENNLMRMLAEPNLVAISGQDASFLAGGEFPVPVPQSGAGAAAVITVEFHEFGIRLHFVPQVLGNGKIRLKVAPEVSELDFANGTTINGGRVPAFTKRMVTTTVELGDGQTFALAGLLDNKVTATVDSIPLLGDIPILGTLFRSTQFQRNESELVVIVTPRLVEPMDPDQVPLLPGEHWRYPTAPQLYLGRDMGGPVVEPGSASADKTGKTPAGPPPQFQGAYGFSPVGAGSAAPAR
jgi:pilus assembly protein CpaC